MAVNAADADVMLRSEEFNDSGNKSFFERYQVCHNNIKDCTKFKNPLDKMPLEIGSVGAQEILSHNLFTGSALPANIFNNVQSRKTEFVANV